MAGPAAMIAPPPGWQAHQLWADLELELHTRQAGIAMACVTLALLIVAAIVFLGPLFYRWRAARLESRQST